jgi:hypothetical protein
MCTLTLGGCSLIHAAPVHQTPDHCLVPKDCLHRCVAYAKHLLSIAASPAEVHGEACVRLMHLAPVSTSYGTPDMHHQMARPAGAGVGACGGNAARPGHDGAGHRPGLFRAHPHAALQLPREQCAPPGEPPHPPLRTRVLPGLHCFARDLFRLMPMAASPTL